MKNTLVMMVGIADYGLLFFSSEVFADDKKDNNQIKICLAVVYTGQTDFYKKNDRYAKNLTEVDLKKGTSHYCNKVELDFSKVENKSFIVLATLGNSFWSVDNEKNIIQLR